MTTTSTSAPAVRAPATYRVAGVTLVLSSVLLLVRSVLEAILGPPPTTGEEIVRWVSDGALLVSLVNELVVIGAALQVPAVVVLFRVLDGARGGWAALGVGLLASAIPVTLVLGVVHGRLVYPVYGLEVTDPASLLLVAATYYGGQHLVSLLLAVGVATVSLLARRSLLASGAVLWLGLAAGTTQVVVSFPGLVPVAAALALQGLLVAWLAVVGVRLARLPVRSGREPAA